MTKRKLKEIIIAGTQAAKERGTEIGELMDKE